MRYYCTSLFYNHVYYTKQNVDQRTNSMQFLTLKQPWIYFSFRFYCLNRYVFWPKVIAIFHGNNSGRGFSYRNRFFSFLFAADIMTAKPVVTTSRLSSDFWRSCVFDAKRCVERIFFFLILSIWFWIFPGVLRNTQNKNENYVNI